MFGRSRFGELIDRQLRLFEEDQRELLAEAAEADEAWTDALRDETEERYGDYQLVLEAIADALAGVRDHYASSLDDRSADEYRAAFDRAARKRLRRLAAALGDS